MKKILLFIVMGVCLMGMSAQRSVSGKLALVGNEPFSYYVLDCDNGDKLRLETKKDEWLELQRRRVELIYVETGQEKILPIVKVIELKAK